MKTESSVWMPYEATRQDPWDFERSPTCIAGPDSAARGRSCTAILRLGRPRASSGLFHGTGKPTVSYRCRALKRATGDNREPIFRYRGDPRSAQAWWLYRMVYGNDLLGEKLALFWHNHFATGLHGVYERD